MKKRTSQKKLYRANAVLQIFLLTFLISPLHAHAFLGSIGDVVGGVLVGVGSLFGGGSSVSDALDTVEERYNFSNEDVQEDLTDRLGTAHKKILQPKVNLTFIPNNPQPGQKVKAIATAENFQSNTNDLYFTWMLRSSASAPEEDGDDDDIQKSVNDAKIIAARINARGNYGGPAGIGNRQKVPEVPEEEIDDNDTIIDLDDDGYRAALGGHGNKNRENFCYIQDDDDGELELRDGGVDEPAIITCPNGGRPACAQQVVARECPVSQLPIGTTPTDDPDNPGTTIPIVEGGGGVTFINEYECLETVAPSCNFSGQAYCSDGSLLVCEMAPNSLINNRPSHCSPSSELATFLLDNPEVRGVGETCTSLGVDGRDHGPLTVLSGAGIECELVTEDDTDNLCEGIGDKKDNDSFVHLFPENDEDHILGDGEFNKEEEEFYGTNPLDSNTADITGGRGDEANALGLGINEFSWTYQAGDEVNIVIEGFTGATKHDDSSRQITWGFADNSCTADELIDLSDGDFGKGKYILKRSEDKGKEIKTLEAEDVERFKEVINSCLHKHFIAPGTGDQPGSLDVELSYSPRNPSAATGGARDRGRAGDVVRVTATPTNAQKDTNQIYYTWCAEIVGSIDAGRTVDPDAPLEDFRLNDDNRTCGEITDEGKNALLDEGAVTLSSVREGLGLSTLSFRLESLAGSYLKVRAELNENFKTGAAGSTQDGAGFVYIPLNNPGVYIEARSGIVGGDLGAGAGLCNTGGLNAAACRVAKNEIIALSVEQLIDNRSEQVALGDFTWEISNARSCQTTKCLTGDQRVRYITPTGQVGERVHVIANGTDVKTGANITVSRSFSIVIPSIQIIADGATPKELGAYLDLDGNEYADESKTSFSATPGSTPTLTAQFHPSWARNNATLTWNVNGQEVSGDSVSVEINGTSQVTLQALYAPPAQTRKILDKSFNISQFSSTEQLLTDSIRITPTPSAEIARSGPERLLASVATNTPGYFLFLLRIALTTILILFVASLVMSLGEGSRRKIGR